MQGAYYFYSCVSSSTALNKFTTLICYRHRLSTIRIADYILVMHEGQIVEQVHMMN
jgi:ABC-type multidrug transport system fused ATPase/permease subunit